MRKNTDFTPWIEFDKVDKEKTRQNFEKFGLTVPVVANLATRGIVIKSLDCLDYDQNNQSRIVWDTITGSPADKLWNKNISDPTLSKDDCLEIIMRIIYAAVKDDHDHFRAQWPELFDIDDAA